MAVHYDPRDPAVIADPYPVLRRLQDEEPAHWSAALGGWVLTRYADVRDSLKDPRLSADRITPFLDHLPTAQRGEIGALGEMLGRWIVFMDPPRHTRLRALMNKAFTSRALTALRPRVAAIVEDLIDGFAARGEADLIRDFAYPLPATVIAGMVGVPEGDLDRFKAWSNDLAAFVGSALETPDKRIRAQRSVVVMTEYFREVISRRRRYPPAGPDTTIIDLLIAAEERGDALSEAELVANAVLLLFAGHETTTNLFGNGMLALLRNPHQLARLAADPALAEPAVEELLRYDGPLGAVTRVAAAPATIHGRAIAPGDRVFAMLHAANRDPRQFPEPDRLDLTRAANRHVVFGYGIHFCLGAPLARMEGQIGFPALLRRLHGIELAEPAPEWTDSLVLRGVKSLPIRFHAG